MTLIHHWGRWIDSELPVGSVLNVNDAPYLAEDILYNGINLTFEEYIEDGGDPDMYESYDDVYVLGFAQDEDGLYDVDDTAEISAIMEGHVIQVVRSKYVTKGTPCSPCYPGQCTIDPEGEFLCYAPGPEYYEEM